MSEMQKRRNLMFRINFVQIPFSRKAKEKIDTYTMSDKVIFPVGKGTTLWNIIWMRYKIFHPGVERHIFIKQASGIAGSWRWRQTGCCFLSAKKTSRHSKEHRVVSAPPSRPPRTACQHVLLAEFEQPPFPPFPPRFRSARQRNAAGLRDVIQFKNHSLSARTEISFFFVREKHIAARSSVLAI